MTTPTLAPITTCVHCGARFDGGVEIIGKPTARVEALLMKLGSHMNTKHAEHVVPLEINGAAYMGMLFLSNFKSTDAALNLERDRQRWQVHQQTLNARFSDESLLQQCKALAKRIYDVSDGCGPGVSEDIAQMLYEAMASVRDALEEPNRYAPEKREQLVS